MHVTLLYNPGAGKGRAARHIAEAVAWMRGHGVDVDFFPSRNREHLIELGRKASSTPTDRIVACGGDGTVHLVLRELDLARTTFGILPLGSGDDFAKTLGIPTRLDDACRNVLEGVVTEVDVALANGIRYVCVGGLGFDAEVNRFANESVSRLRGSALYLYSTLRVLSKFEPKRITLTIDGESRPEEIMFAVVANAPRYGAGIHIAPAAKTDDGKLDLCLVRKCSKFELIRTLPLAYSGGHIRRPFVICSRGKDFRIESETPMVFYADGELVTETPVSITLSEERLRVVIPRG